MNKRQAKKLNKASNQILKTYLQPNWENTKRLREEIRNYTARQKALTTVEILKTIGILKRQYRKGIVCDTEAIKSDFETIGKDFPI